MRPAEKRTLADLNILMQKAGYKPAFLKDDEWNLDMAFRSNGVNFLGTLTSHYEPELDFVRFVLQPKENPRGRQIERRATLDLVLDAKLDVIRHVTQELCQPAENERYLF